MYLVAVKEYLVEGGKYCLGAMPGQLYARFLIFLILGSLGEYYSGIYVYIRNFISASTQVVGFIKRAEFPMLVREKISGLGIILRVQYLSNAVSLFLVVIYALARGLNLLNINVLFSDVVNYIDYFILIIPLLSFSSSYSRALVSKSCSGYFASIIWLTLPIALIIQMLLIDDYGILVLAYTEVAMLLVQLLLYVVVIKIRLVVEVK